MKPCFSLLFVCAFVAFESQPAVGADSSAESLGLISSHDYSEQLKGVQSLVTSRDHLISALVALLTNSPSLEAKEAAATVLGAYRAAEAVEALLDNFELDSRPRIMKGLLTEEQIRPISTALIKIGAPAIPGLLARIKRVDDAAHLNALAGICITIEGRETIKCILLNRIDNETDAIARERLFRAYELAILPVLTATHTESK
jgi:hypothetical protein